MKKKMHLEEIQVKSFVTGQMREVKGGYELTDISCQGVCHLSVEVPCGNPTENDCGDPSFVCHTYFLSRCPNC